VIKEKLGSRLDHWIHLAFPFLFMRPVNPNLLTLLGSLISLGAAWAFSDGHFRTAGLVLLAAGFFDLVDGAVARHFGTTSSFGALLDSTLDRMVDMVVMLGLVMYYGERGAWVPELLAAVILVSSIVTSYTKARAELTIDHLPGGLVERGERVGLLAAGAVFGLMLPVLWILALGTTWTAGQRMRSAYREMELIDAMRAGTGERA
jgi:CDP-diacylglycerol--glycerol-3-phosphate 3-phosphatidyltransferase